MFKPRTILLYEEKKENQTFSSKNTEKKRFFLLIFCYFFSPDMPDSVRVMFGVRTRIPVLFYGEQFEPDDSGYNQDQTENAQHGG